MTVLMELRRMGLSKKDAHSILRSAEMYSKNACRENDRNCPGWRNAKKNPSTIIVEGR